MLGLHLTLNHPDEDASQRRAEDLTYLQQAVSELHAHAQTLHPIPQSLSATTAAGGPLQAELAAIRARGAVTNQGSTTISVTNAYKK